MSKPLDQQIFDRAFELIKTSWCRCQRALTMDDCPVNTWAPDAAKFCAFGAIDRAFWEALGIRPDVIHPAYNKVVTRLWKAGERVFPEMAPLRKDNNFSLMGVNDSRKPGYGQAGMIKIFEEAEKNHE